ncbi:MAG: hypothetical protein ACPGID_08445, partial [Rubricella sp.]
GGTVFELAEEDESGFVSLPGRWIHCDPSVDPGKVRHRDHRFRRTARERRISPKWCTAGTGPADHPEWRLHGFRGRGHNVKPDTGFFHCRQISTGWSYNREPVEADGLEPDPSAGDILGSVEAFRDD